VAIRKTRRDAWGRISVDVAGLNEAVRSRTVRVNVGYWYVDHQRTRGHLNMPYLAWTGSFNYTLSLTIVDFEGSLDLSLFIAPMEISFGFASAIMTVTGTFQDTRSEGSTMWDDSGITCEKTQCAAADIAEHQST